MASNPMKTAFPIYNGYAPAEGAKGLPVDLNFTVNATLDFDLMLENAQGVIQYVQSMWVDNSTNPNALTFNFGTTSQRVTIPAFASGVWPVITSDQLRVRISSTVGATSLAQVIFLNVPMPLTQSGPINVTAGPVPASVVVANISGTITTGGVSQLLHAASPLIRNFVLQAPSTNTESLWYNYQLAANVGSPSLELRPGDTVWLSPPNDIYFPGVVNITAATTGTQFTGKRFLRE